MGNWFSDAIDWIGDQIDAGAEAVGDFLEDIGVAGSVATLVDVAESGAQLFGLGYGISDFGYAGTWVEENSELGLDNQMGLDESAEAGLAALSGAEVDGDGNLDWGEAFDVAVGVGLAYVTGGFSAMDGTGIDGLELAMDEYGTDQADAGGVTDVAQADGYDIDKGDTLGVDLLDVSTVDLAADDVEQGDIIDLGASELLASEDGLALYDVGDGYALIF